MAKSKTEICNLAVSWLGGDTILSIDDDDSLEANLCRVNYDQSRKAVLEERDWTFAVKRDTLTPLAVDPVFGYEYSFLVPSDLLRLIGAYDPRYKNRSNPPTLQHSLEDNTIYANKSAIDIKYIKDVTNTNRFSALFGQALAAHIATNIATPLTEDPTQQKRMAIMYEDKLDKAAASDGLQGSNELLNTSQLEKSRRMFVRPY